MGDVYYKSLSAVAHSRPHGLAQHLVDTRPGDGNMTEVLPGLRAEGAAQRLMAAPLAAVCMVESLFPTLAGTST
ncbi:MULTISPECIES: hypothetical protein [unclassified Pseudofrankia]|uniref:hypothetical protein n=1 Tax=unclassified Pseudofrankia TaxID=2994372 RepID=UPI0008D98EFD|nr:MULTISPECIES: hypothetical protein [unclassified Pseudofrankia]MDT3442923.1 hypothetical protein [Pseudofrankia sp. BMG5.37]OHV62862.1 hypothetical protein BCD48_38955 [Pseudofrankia sp. BMG5.36]